MNYAELAFTAANTVLLLVLFFYQRNRNKVLEDQLAAQKQLIDETKSVVTQQSSAIEGQSRVVDTALKYTNAFDPKKLEELIRRELTIEHREELARVRAQAESSGGASPEVTDPAALVDQVVHMSTQAASEAVMEVFRPLTPIVLRALFFMPEDERESTLAEVPEGIRGIFRKALAKLEEEVRKQRIHGA